MRLPDPDDRHVLAAAVHGRADAVVEVGLDFYAAVCRSEATSRVHAAFEVSMDDGFAEFRRARDASGIDPPDTPSFAWGGVMGLQTGDGDGSVGPPSIIDVNLATHDAVVVLEVFGMLEVRGT